MGNKLEDFEPIGAPARVSDSTYNAAFTKEIEIAIPEGKHARGILLDVDVTPTATGTGTAYLAEMINRVTVLNEKGDKVLESDGNAGLGILAVFLGILAKLTQSVTAKNVVAATATSYNSYWYFAQAMKGKVFTIRVEFLSPAAALTGLTVTGCSTTVGAVILVSDEPGEIIKVKENNLASATQFAADGGQAYFVASASELGSVISGMSIDNQTLSAEQVISAENITAMKEVGLTTAGAAGAVQYMPGVQFPTGTGVLYGIAVSKNQAAKLSVILSAATTMYLCKVEADVAPVRVVRAQ
jgi:hypothetical protein